MNPSSAAYKIVIENYIREEKSPQVTTTGFNIYNPFPSAAGEWNPVIGRFLVSCSYQKKDRRSTGALEIARLQHGQSPNKAPISLLRPGPVGKMFPNQSKRQSYLRNGKSHHKHPSHISLFILYTVM